MLIGSASANLAPERGWVDRKLGEGWKRATIHAGESSREPERPTGQNIGLDVARFRLHDPVVRNTVSRVQLKLDAPVHRKSRGRQYFDGECRRPLEGPGAAERIPSALEAHDVRLDDARCAGDAIKRRREDS